MTYQKINLSSTDLSDKVTFETSDGKLVHFLVFATREKPSALTQRIEAQLKKVDKELVSHFLIASSDWKEVYEATDKTFIIDGVRGRHSNVVNAGTFQLVFGGEE
jgi:hypothetical protein